MLNIRTKSTTRLIPVVVENRNAAEPTFVTKR